jgi:DNA-binding NtrC family response regulator
VNPGAQSGPVRLDTPVPLPPEDCPIVAVSASMRRAVGLALRFAPTELPILLVGPTGSGKELFARQIHIWSRRAGPLVDINAGALPREMVESLLFGHRRGAFTGAVQSTEGLVTAAGQGTLFLDELASLPAEGQAKLLRVLECGQVRPLGETLNRPVRCRFVAAVQDDLDAKIASGAFRPDLYQRLAGVVIRIPALAERPEDVVPLARRFAFEQGKVLTVEAEVALLAQRWPGNVRELRSAIVRATLLGEGGSILETELREAIALSGPAIARLPRAVAGPPGIDLVAHCRAHEWEIESAAAALGVSRATLYRRLRESGIDPGRWRSEPGQGLRMER